jgi:hypothetical protein
MKLLYIEMAGMTSNLLKWNIRHPHGTFISGTVRSFIKKEYSIC